LSFIFVKTVKTEKKKKCWETLKDWLKFIFKVRYGKQKTTILIILDFRFGVLFNLFQYGSKGLNSSDDYNIKYLMDYLFYVAI
jgi:hypothetical protein